MFLDETGATTNMTRRYGWTPRSERLVDATPWGHWSTTTFVAGLRASGIVAPWLIGGAMDGAAFRTYVEQVLVPELRKDDVVVMDNLPAHKVLRDLSDLEVFGSGAPAARRALPPDPMQRDIIGVLQAVIDDPAEPGVGGNVQYGSFQGARFQPAGVARIGEGVHYWRGPLDLNGPDFVDGGSLVPNFPLLDFVTSGSSVTRP